MVWLPKARLEFATDASMASELAREDSDASKAVVERIRPVAAGIISEDPTLVAAAAARIDDEIETRDLLQGGDPRALPTGTAFFTPLPPSTGYLGAWMVERDRRQFVAMGLRLDGTLRGKFDAGPAGVATNIVPDCIPEWWIGPPPQRFLGWTATAGLGSEGQVLAVDYNDRTGPVAVQVATVTADDHNVPGRFTIPGRGSLMQWTLHGATHSIYLCAAPGSGRAETFTGRPTVAINVGGPASYGQIWHLAHLQTSTTDTFWVLLRNDLNWGVQEVVVDWSTGAVTASGAFKKMVSFADQPYMHSVPVAFDASGNATKFGIILGYNPTASRDEVFLLEIDVTTGILHDKANPAVTHNINSGSYLAHTALRAVLPDKPTGTRRVFGLYVDGVIWKLLTGEYAGAVAPTGTYEETSFNVSTGVITGSRTIGVMGAHLERYPAGAQFAPDGTVWSIRESGNVYTLYNEGTAVLLSADPLFRILPVYPAPGIPALIPGKQIDVFVGRVYGEYTDYLDWDAVALVGVKKEVLV